MQRGNNAFRRILPQTRTIMEEPVSIGDLFLHVMFARLALTNSETIEFSTKFNKDTNTIELEIPDKAIPLFDELTGMKRGPKFQAYIDWLIGSKQFDQATEGFIPMQSLDVWFGAKQSLTDTEITNFDPFEKVYDEAGKERILLLPLNELSTLSYNSKSNELAQHIKVLLVWKFIEGANTKFYMRTSLNINDPSLLSPILISNDIEISTFNLIRNDIRESLLIETDINPNNIIHILMSRGFEGSLDAKTELIGIIGIRIIYS